jgi:two-component system chemotaxis sensor kinase CheA
LREPVLHLLRNAVAHGVEQPAQRRAAGKSIEGVIRLQIASHAAGLEIGVQDDGQGIDLGRVRELCIARGIDTAQLGEGELERFIFQPGFSTAANIDAVSGRGVGLDVVRDVVERAGGSVALEHVRGVGTRFVLRMPPSLTTMRVLIVRVAGSVLALPVSAIGRIVRVDRDAVRQVNSGPAIEIDGRAVPLARLATLLELGGSATALDRVPAVVVGSAAERCTLVVDAIDGEQELVVSGLGDYLRHNANIAGASVLSGGEIVPVLNVASIVRRVAQKPQSSRVFEPRADQAAPRKRVLIVDDSITTRTLEKSILEAVGYAVEVATDGVDALQKLRVQRFDLMLSDVQMPRMDGIELVTRVRADAELRRLKVVLVSSLNAGDDRKRGLTAGADAYIGKNEFRQDLLLQTLERLL